VLAGAAPWAKIDLARQLPRTGRMDAAVNDLVLQVHACVS
jgi:hypothetical protein